MAGLISKTRRFVRQLSKVNEQVSDIQERMEYEEYSSQIWRTWFDTVAGAKKRSLYPQVVLGTIATLVLFGFWLVVEFFQQSHPSVLFCARGGLIVLLLATLTAAWRLWQYFVEADEALTKKIAKHYEDDIAAATGTAASQHAQTRSEFDRNRRNHTPTATTATHTQNRPAGGYAPPPRRQ